MTEHIRPINENSFLEVVKFAKPDKEILQMAEGLCRMNPILLDASFKEANKGDYEEKEIRQIFRNERHDIINRLSGRKVEFKLYKAEDSFSINREEISDDIIKDSLPGLEKQSLGEVDNWMSHVLFNGDNEKYECTFDGFVSQHSKLLSRNKDILVDTKGKSNRTCEIWLVGWSLDNLYMIYPKGTPAGLCRNLTKTNAEMKLYLSWDSGLVMWDTRVDDFHSVVRICNVDKNLAYSGEVNLPSLITSNLVYLDQGKDIRTAIYSDIETLYIAKGQDSRHGGVNTLFEKDIYGLGFKSTTVLGIPWHPLNTLNMERAGIPNL